MKRILPLLMFIALSCKHHTSYTPFRIEGKQVPVTERIHPDQSVLDFIAPYKNHIDKEMNTILAFSSYNLRKTDGDLNTPIGNMMADAVMELTNPVYKARTGRNIDIVLLNYGGIRSTISKGSITTRTAFQVMPFENEVVVARLKGQQVREMVRYLIDSGTAHPISGLQLHLDQDNSIENLLIQGKPLQEDRLYDIATSDYLLTGGDNMIFFSKAEDVSSLEYKIRNVLIDYFKKYDTIAPEKDLRFIRNK